MIPPTLFKNKKLERKVMYWVYTIQSRNG